MHGIGRVAGSTRPLAARGGGHRGFTVGLAASGTASGPERTAAAGPLGAGLLGLQESGEAAARDAAAARRGDSLLEELQGLQADMLRGGADPGRLRRLAALGDGDDGADPGLREAVRAISLRARIELARRGWFPAVSGA